MKANTGKNESVLPEQKRNGGRHERCRKKWRMLDQDDVNLIVQEDRQYRQWETEQKNRILRMHDPDRKIAEWKRLFGNKEEPDDSYLEGNVF